MQIYIWDAVCGSGPCKLPQGELQNSNWSERETHFRYVCFRCRYMENKSEINQRHSGTSRRLCLLCHFSQTHAPAMKSHGKRQQWKTCTELSPLCYLKSLCHQPVTSLIMASRADSLCYWTTLPPWLAILQHGSAALQPATSFGGDRKVWGGNFNGATTPVSAPKAESARDECSYRSVHSVQVPAQRGVETGEIA